MYQRVMIWPADSVLQGAGLNIGAATMKIGEIAVFQVHPDLGYGSKGEHLLTQHEELPWHACTMQTIQDLDHEPLSFRQLFVPVCPAWCLVGVPGGNDRF